MSDESSTSQVMIPETWIEPRLTSSGFLPDVGVHLRGGKLVQEASRSVWIGAAVMCSFGLFALIPIPWFGFVIPKNFDIPYFVQIFVTLGCFWGALCAVVGTAFIQKGYGVSATLDLQSQIICVSRNQFTVKIPTCQVVGLQILRGPKDTGGHQLNLVFMRESGEVDRESLHTNGYRCYVMRLAKAYQKFAGWPIFETDNR